MLMSAVLLLTLTEGLWDLALFLDVALGNGPSGSVHKNPYSIDAVNSSSKSLLFTRG